MKKRNNLAYMAIIVLVLLILTFTSLYIGSFLYSVVNFDYPTRSEYNLGMDGDYSTYTEYIYSGGSDAYTQNYRYGKEFSNPVYLEQVSIKTEYGVCNSACYGDQDRATWKLQVLKEITQVGGKVEKIWLDYPILDKKYLPDSTLNAKVSQQMEIMTNEDNVLAVRILILFGQTDCGNCGGYCRIYELQTKTSKTRSELLKEKLEKDEDISELIDQIDDLQLTIEKKAEYLRQLKLSNEEFTKVVAELELSNQELQLLIEDYEDKKEEQDILYAQLVDDYKEKVRILKEYASTSEEIAAYIKVIEPKLENQGLLLDEYNLILQQEAEVLASLAQSNAELKTILDNMKEKSVEEKQQLEEATRIIQEKQNIIDKLKQELADEKVQGTNAIKILISAIIVIIILFGILILYITFRKK